MWQSAVKTFAILEYNPLGRMAARSMIFPKAISSKGWAVIYVLCVFLYTL